MSEDSSDKMAPIPRSHSEVFEISDFSPFSEIEDNKSENGNQDVWKILESQKPEPLKSSEATEKENVSTFINSKNKYCQ